MFPSKVGMSRPWNHDGVEVRSRWFVNDLRGCTWFDEVQDGSYKLGLEPLQVGLYLDNLNYPLIKAI